MKKHIIISICCLATFIFSSCITSDPANFCDFYFDNQFYDDLHVKLRTTDRLCSYHGNNDSIISIIVPVDSCTFITKIHSFPSTTFLNPDSYFSQISITDTDGDTILHESPMTNKRWNIEESDGDFPNKKCTYIFKIELP
ncbi:MAG: hypothetical protein IJY67_00510 [Paludibacteraceae bacterium]|nr:hypothetical protein [Paludibacteraceae bacterium]